MANKFDTTIGMIEKLILDNTRFFVPRLGQVTQVNDELQKGRILVNIPSLGWDTDDKGAWCYPKDKQSLITPNVGDWVIVEFIDGDRDYPIYSGIANQMKDMLPLIYDGKHTSQVIFEDKEQSTYVLYDEEAKEFIIEDSHGNKITLKDGKILIEGTEIKLLNGGEHFVKGDTLKTELQKNVDALNQLQTDFTTWVPVPNDGGAALKTILSTGFLVKSIATLANILSTLIEGE